VFEPHITLHGGIINHDRTLHVLRKLPVASSYELEMEGIFSSPKFTKTLFIRYRLSDELRELRSAIAQALDLESEDDFDPHLSLLYKEMPRREQEELVRSIKIPFQRATFAGLKLIAHPPKIMTRADVEVWREIGRYG
jgi:2'-5' RNA ligase